MKRFQSRHWYKLALYASSFSLIYSPLSHTAEDEETALIAKSDATGSFTEDIYTINFNDVSIIELIRFTSKITGLNFVFEEADLKFTVTVVSEESISSQSVLSALSQVLRMHDLKLLEQNGNILITKSRTISQIPQIISSDLMASEVSETALVTRVFRIRNTNIGSIAGIIRPLISETALLEILPETKQLIVTDITTNVDQIAILLETLDTPHSPLEIDTYQSKNLAPIDLIALATQILAPFNQGGTLLLVPQTHTNSIFIVSTPYLIEKTLSILEDLDSPPVEHVIIPTEKESEMEREKPLEVGKSSFFIYHPKHRPGEELEEELEHLEENFADAGLADPNFLKALDSMQWNPGTNSLIFTGTPQAIEKIKTLLTTIDVGESIAPTTKGIFLYKLKNVKCEGVLAHLKKLAEKIPKDTPQNQHLIAAINNIECIPANNSLLISGTTGAIDQIKVLASEFDIPEAAHEVSPEASLFIYKPQYLSASEIEAALIAITSAASQSGLKDAKLHQVVESMRYVEETNSLIFIGAQSTLNKLKGLLSSIDTKEAKKQEVTKKQGEVTKQKGEIEEIDNVTFYLYKPLYVPADELITSLKKFAQQLDQSNITNKELVNSIDHVKLTPDTNSLLFTGNRKVLEQIGPLIKKFDTPKAGEEVVEKEAVPREASDFVIYNPRYLSGDELISTLREFMYTLEQAGVSDPKLYDVIDNLKWMEKTSSLVISGNPEAVEKAQQLLTRFDVPGEEAKTPAIESIDNTSFLVYKLQYHPGSDIQTALKEIAKSLEKSGSSAEDLMDAIESIQWIQITNSLLCTGHQDVLVRIKDLIENLDIPLKQVFIEVLIIETTLTNQQNFGLMWGGQVKYMDKTILNTGNFPVTNDQGSLVPSNGVFRNSLQGINGSRPPTSASIPFTTGFDLGVIGDIIMHKGKSFISLGSLLNAIQQDTDSTIILNPKIIAQDNRQSSIFVGQNVPYTGAIVTTTQNNTTQTANIEYRDVGVNLTITPILGEGDIVTMDIVQDISELVNADNVSTSQTVLTGIQTSHTHMETRVHVPSNHFVALSGLIDDTKTHFKTGLPCLGGLPVIGALFSETNRGATKNNIIVFVRPQIITSYQEYKAITEHQEWTYKDNARLPALKEDFDEGIDLIKIPENE